MQPDDADSLQAKTSWKNPSVILFIVSLVFTNGFSVFNSCTLVRNGVLDAKEQKLEQQEGALDQRELSIKREALELSNSKKSLEAAQTRLNNQTSSLKRQKQDIEAESASIRQELQSMEKLRALHLNMHSVDRGTNFALHIGNEVSRDKILTVLPELQSLKTVSLIDLNTPDISIEDLSRALGSRTIQIKHLSFTCSPSDYFASIKQFSNLQTLKIDFQGPTNAHGLLDALTSLPELNSLVINGQAIRASDEQTSFRLSKLEHLGLDGKNLTYLFLKNADFGVELKTFVAPSSLSKSAQLRNLARQPNLTTLDIAGLRSIEEDDLAILFNGARLEQLRVSSCDLPQNCIAKQVEALQKLKYLDISYCNLSNADWQAIGNLPQLETLIAQGCDLGDGSINYLAASATLKNLILNQSRLDESGVQSFDHHRTLERIHLANLRSPGATAPMAPRLKEIVLSGNNVDTASVALKLSRLPNLEKVYWAFANMHGSEDLEILLKIPHLKLLAMPFLGLPAGTSIPEYLHAPKLEFSQVLWPRSDFALFVRQDQYHARQYELTEWAPTLVAPTLLMTWK
ncbi:hypothetical protein Rcae01_02734 [Novipirellula caenicola]|uniref:Leucine Rich repeats (2 copies) n=2 Tax=Novipirellula caenicola TaxID=1536901 RepID=A0ABP9VQ13_9BACT